MSILGETAEDGTANAEYVADDWQRACFASKYLPGISIVGSPGPFSIHRTALS